MTYEVISNNALKRRCFCLHSGVVSALQMAAFNSVTKVTWHDICGEITGEAATHAIRTRDNGGQSLSHRSSFSTSCVWSSNMIKLSKKQIYSFFFWN